MACRLADGLALADGLSDGLSDGLADGLAGACEPGWILQLRLGIRSQLRL